MYSTENYGGESSFVWFSLSGTSFLAEETPKKQPNGDVKLKSVLSGKKNLFTFY